jgi:hypothetical protein
MDGIGSRCDNTGFAVPVNVGVMEAGSNSAYKLGRGILDTLVYPVNNVLYVFLKIKKILL